ncbi:MAG: insulinase family protein [Myxococcota bacterium]
MAERYLGAAPSVVAQASDNGEIEDATILTQEIAAAYAQYGTAKTKTVHKTKPELIEKRFANGATLVIESTDAPIVAIRAAALGGQRYEDVEKQGLGALSAAMWGLATRQDRAEVLAHRTAMLGGSVAAFSGRNALGLRGEFIAECAGEGLDLFCDILTEPELLAADFERERAVLLQRIKNRAESPGGICFDVFVKSLFPNHPYGWRSTGTDATVKSLALEDVRQHIACYGAPGGLVVVVVGGADPQMVLDTMGPLLECGTTRTHRDPPRADDPPKRLRRVHEVTRKCVAYYYRRHGNGHLDDPDRYPLEVLTTLLSGQEWPLVHGSA